MSEEIIGYIGHQDKGEGFPVRFVVEEERIVGRAGGRVQGKKIELRIVEQGIEGEVDGQSIRVSLEGGELRGKIGEQQVVLRGVDHVTGFFGQPMVGWNVDARHSKDTMQGVFGGTVLNFPFVLKLDGVPGWMGVLAALSAFYALEPRAR